MTSTELYLLERVRTSCTDDVVEGFVVRASSERRARELASEACGEEGPAIWIASVCSSCVRLEPAGDESIVLRDFRSPSRECRTNRIPK